MKAVYTAFSSEFLRSRLQKEHRNGVLKDAADVGDTKQRSANLWTPLPVSMSVGSSRPLCAECDVRTDVAVTAAHMLTFLWVSRAKAMLMFVLASVNILDIIKLHASDDTPSRTVRMTRWGNRCAGKTDGITSLTRGHLASLALHYCRRSFPHSLLIPSAVQPRRVCEKAVLRLLCGEHALEHQTSQATTSAEVTSSKRGTSRLHNFEAQATVGLTDDDVLTYMESVGPL